MEGNRDHIIVHIKWNNEAHLESFLLSLFAIRNHQTFRTKSWINTWIMLPRSVHKHSSCHFRRDIILGVEWSIAIFVKMISDMHYSHSTSWFLLSFIRTSMPQTEVTYFVRINLQSFFRNANSYVYFLSNVNVEINFCSPEFQAKSQHLVTENAKIPNGFFSCCRFVINSGKYELISIGRNSSNSGVPTTHPTSAPPVRNEFHSTAIKLNYKVIKRTARFRNERRRAEEEKRIYRIQTSNEIHGRDGARRKENVCWPNNCFFAFSYFAESQLPRRYLLHSTANCPHKYNYELETCPANEMCPQHTRSVSLSLNRSVLSLSTFD